MSFQLKTGQILAFFSNDSAHIQKIAAANIRAINAPHLPFILYPMSIRKTLNKYADSWSADIVKSEWCVSTKANGSKIFCEHDPI